MSSIPPATTDPIPPAPSAAPVETAPSAIMAEGPTLARAVGFVGLFLLVLGAVVVITTRAVGPRWVSEGYGFVFAGVGLALMLYHAVTDGEQEVRRMYGGLAAGLLVLALATAIIPGPFDAPSSSKTAGHYLLPWGVGAGFLALMFAVPFTRHETDDQLRNVALKALLAIGAALCGWVVIFGVFKPDFLAGTGLALAVLGVGFICAYLSQVDTSEGPGYTVAFALGALGAAALFYAFARTVFPTVLFEGPAVLRKPNQTLDPWAVAGRVLVIVIFLSVIGGAVMRPLSRWRVLLQLGIIGPLVILALTVVVALIVPANAAVGVGVVRFVAVAVLVFTLLAWAIESLIANSPTWLRGALAGVGLIGAAVFVAASLGTQLTTPPKPFLVPSGLIMGGIGALYLALAVGVCSDNQFVTLTRRELATYFISPIGYLVLGGMAAAEWIGYSDFYELLAERGKMQQPLEEPIVRRYFVSLFPVVCVVLQIPALTMRLLAEERRTGSLEVLLTSPVSETPVVLSKFLATWLFFLISWLPAGLFLVALRMEAGQPFDYRPLLSFYLALAACGAAFVAAGLFFSSLTSNQIVAAVLTFALMFFLMYCYFLKERATGFGLLGRQFFTRLSYIDLWLESLNGQLPVRDILVWASAAVFGLFLSIKTLEARKWN